MLKSHIWLAAVSNFLILSFHIAYISPSEQTVFCYQALLVRLTDSVKYLHFAVEFVLDWIDSSRATLDGFFIF